MHTAFSGVCAHICLSLLPPFVPLNERRRKRSASAPVVNASPVRRNHRPATRGHLPSVRVRLSVRAALATLQHAFSLSITLQTFNTVQFWLEGIFFTAFGIVGLVGALVTIAVLATRDLRDFQTNEEVALS